MLRYDPVATGNRSLRRSKVGHVWNVQVGLRG